MNAQILLPSHVLCEICLCFQILPISSSSGAILCHFCVKMAYLYDFLCMLTAPALCYQESIIVLRDSSQDSIICMCSKLDLSNPLSQGIVDITYPLQIKHKFSCISYQSIANDG